MGVDRDLNVLIADDSEDDALLLIRELRKGGLLCQFERVDDPEAMRRALNLSKWDLVVTDHNMPSFSSADALQLVKLAQPETPVIVVSGTISDDVAVHSMKSGAQDYIMKDNLSRLVPVVERELREVAQRDAHLQAQQKIAYLSHHDTLTNLINREQFKNYLQTALDSAHQTQAQHALLYVDLDQFKIINDACGHQAGDELLKQIGELIKGVIGERDCVSRMGGDEFGVLLTDCNPQEACAMAAKLHKSIEQHRFVWSEQPFMVSACTGIVLIDNSSMDVEEVLSSADMASYAAKDKGQSFIQVYDLNNQDLTLRKEQMRWASKIRRALDENAFVLYKQPIVGLKSDAVHYEFLVRMLDEGELVAPGLFIPAAERFNLMTSIDRWVVDSAFSFVRRCIDKKANFKGVYFINLSGSSLNDETFFESVRECKRRYDIPANQICFEITETTAISNIEATSAFISDIRELGFLFALDDFGVGMSSFAYLKAIPVDVLKIDGGFVRSMLSDPMDLAIVDACNTIAHSAGLKTVAEFVENSEIEDKLRILGVDFAQGYGISKPGPIEDELLEN